MKRGRAIIVLALAFSLLSACAQMTGMQTNVSASPVIDRIVQRGELVVGTAGSMPPLNMTTKKGKIIGLEADLSRYISEAMGVKLRLVPMSFSELLPALEAGKVDLILSGMTMTPKRNLKVAFVGPYFISGKSFLTKTRTLLSVKEASEINNPDTTLAALKGSTSQIFVETAIPKAKLVTTKDYDEAVQMVIQGNVDALVADYPICLVSVFRYPGKELAALTTPLTYEPVGIAVPANDPLLVNWLENFLNTLAGSGEIKELREDWFEDASWLLKLP
jgi:polar amino acid transport system substrate-binding protein